LRVFTQSYLPLFSGCATILTLLTVCHKIYIVSGQLASNQRNCECICIIVYIRNGREHKRKLQAQKQHHLFVHLVISFTKGLSHTEVLTELAKLIDKSSVQSIQLTERECIVTDFNPGKNPNCEPPEFSCIMYDRNAVCELQIEDSNLDFSTFHSTSTKRILYNFPKFRNITTNCNVT
jgi:hypothetical protein